MKRIANHGKIIVAFFAATIVSVLALPIFECIAGFIPKSGYHCGESLFTVLLIGPFLAIPAIVLIALPVFLGLRNCRWTEWWQVVPAASLASIAAFLLLSPVLLFAGFSVMHAIALVILPLLLVFGRSRSVTWWRVTMSGCIAIAIAVMAFKLSPIHRKDIGLLGIFGYIGACSGMVFWLVGIRGNLTTQSPENNYQS